MSFERKKKRRGKLTIPSPNPARIGSPSWFARPEVWFKRSMRPNPSVPSPNPIQAKGRATFRRVMSGPTRRVMREQPVMVGRSCETRDI